MSETAHTTVRSRATVALSALFLSAVALAAGSATTLGHGAGAGSAASAGAARSAAVSTVAGSVPCSMCGG